HQGARVREVNETFIRNMYDVLLLITEYLVTRAVQVVTPSDIEALEQIQARLEEAAEQGAIDRFLTLNNEFNDKIYTLGNNPEAMRIVKQYRGLRDALRYASGFSKERLAAICREHRRLIAALAAGDAQE